MADPVENKLLVQISIIDIDIFNEALVKCADVEEAAMDCLGDCHPAVVRLSKALQTVYDKVAQGSLDTVE